MSTLLLFENTPLQSGRCRKFDTVILPESRPKAGDICWLQLWVAAARLDDLKALLFE